ncbi:SWIRM domain-containing protein [Sporodiniella umbellata]|nr:SWIRM domain-containing protein [Sporodiniella umbellata]
MDEQQATPMDTSSTEDEIQQDSTAIESQEPSEELKKTEAEKSAEEASRAHIELEARKYFMDQAKPVNIPSYTSWFDFNQVHQIERASLPEFFSTSNSSKTATIYTDYRDFMINTYRLNPKEYLTVTACRRNLAGDVCAIMRVHAFLEQWGLINNECDSSTWPSPVGPPFTGHFRITADTPRGLAPFKPNLRAIGTHNSQGTVNVELRQKVFEAANDKSNKEYFCITCGTECTRERFHSLKTKNMDLCAICYKEGRFPVTCFSSDFIRYENQQQEEAKMAKSWSDEETLLLLEAIELYDDDWNTIGDYVGTKSREECIYHFLQLPIEEPYRAGDGKTHSTIVDHKRVPFSQADNPVMSTLAFLASAVDPEVAAAAAAAAIDCQENKRKSEERPEGEEQNKKARSTIETAACVALGSAAAKAKSLSAIEEREIKRLVHSVVDSEMKKIELKMKHFDEMEKVLEYEVEALAQQRKDIFTCRLSIKQTEALLDQEISKRGGIEKAIEDGWSPQHLQQLIHGSLFKEDYHLVSTLDLDYSALSHPQMRMDEGEPEKEALVVLSL